MRIGRTFSATLTALSCGLFVLCTTTPPDGGRALARQQKLTKTEVADNKYGEGGTHITYSDDKLRLREEAWADKDGKFREGRVYDSKGGTEEAAWFFYHGDEHLGINVEVHREIGYPEASLTLHVGKASVSASVSSVEQAEEIAKEIGRQFEKDGVAPTQDDVSRTVKRVQEARAEAIEKKIKEMAKDEGGPTKAEPPKKEETKPTTDSPEKPANPPCGGAIQKVPLAEARAHLNRHVAHIEERKNQMAEAYYYAGAVKTLKKAFGEGGVTDSMDKAEPWGTGGISAAWSDAAEQFYSYHLVALRESLKIIEQRGYSTQGELAELDKGVRGWDGANERLVQQFQSLVNTYVAEAKVYDEKAEYLKKYYATLGQLSGMRPYPSGQVGALNEKMYRDTKALDDRAKKIEVEDEQGVKGEINSLSGRRLFSAVKKVPGC